MYWQQNVKKKAVKNPFINYDGDKNKAEITTHSFFFVFLRVIEGS